jgi:hypothetical protein
MNTSWSSLHESDDFEGRIKTFLDSEKIFNCTHKLEDRNKNKMKPVKLGSQISNSSLMARRLNSMSGSS